ncbi:hypothetical protein IZ6_07500 [Terrihabitans soli]|uniref:HTH cro/C1-type domain-containing protein n=1 Tax=Terrihabitans soli TaxID=708113 RepID=A0A6S6QQH3_9HYPH|nr:helix-turn-helix transcriptional regulator [Terrihabitans soli]BCJ90015.1 hypothetical protein IZ6_07500 [Terrihabitans soli]
MAKTPTRAPLFFKAWRKSRGWTQDYVAEKIDMSGSNYSLLERGEIDYTTKTLTKLAKLYGCSNGDLISRGPNQTEDELIRLARDLPEEKRDQLLKIAKTFLN